MTIDRDQVNEIVTRVRAEHEKGAGGRGADAYTIAVADLPVGVAEHLRLEVMTNLEERIVALERAAGLAP